MVYTFNKAPCRRELEFHLAQAWEQAKLRKSHREGMEDLLLAGDSASGKKSRVGLVLHTS